VRLAVTVVLKRIVHSGHCLRRRIDEPSSEVRESVTRESGKRQNGQNILISPLDLVGFSILNPTGCVYGITRYLLLRT
jgi:hypothetical protein